MIDWEDTETWGGHVTYDSHGSWLDGEEQER